MNGTQSPDAQKNGHNSNSSSLAAKKRKKDGLKPIITMEGASPQPGAGTLQSSLFVFARAGYTVSPKSPMSIGLVVVGYAQYQTPPWIWNQSHKLPCIRLSEEISRNLNKD
ncbi:hypothetical protein F66182_6868 [Fusarium sp. NRRL 66182]|nr:hypothetical protein F66182_6868 [Fusarium sp. NRRL 66182]